MKYIPFFIDDKFNGGYRIYNHKNIGIGSSDLNVE